MAVFDLFGLEEASRLQIQDGISRVLADDYPTKPPGAGGRNRSDIALVLWDDSDLVPRKTVWPVPFTQHADVFEKIAAAKPKALLIDVLFRDRREEGEPLERLRAALGKLRANGVKVYVLNAGGCDDSGLLPELLTGPDGRVSVTTVPAPRKDDLVDGITREIFHVRRPYRRPHSRSFASGMLDGRESHRRIAPSEALEDFWNPLALAGERAGHRPPSLRSSCGRFGGSWASTNASRGLPALRDRSPGDFACGGSREEARGKFVVYGTDFHGARDAVRTSIHDETVPGAVLHAMALDNLREYRTHYIHRGPVTAIGSRELRLTWIDLVMLLAGATLMPWVRVWLRRMVDALANRAPADPQTAMAGRLSVGALDHVALSPAHALHPGGIHRMDRLSRLGDRPGELRRPRLRLDLRRGSTRDPRTHRSYTEETPMTIRAIAVCIAIFSPAAIADAGETVTATTIKGAIADCWGNEKLDGTPTDLKKEEWPGPLRSKDSRGRALLFTIGARQCWLDRSDVVIEGLPSPPECGQGRNGLLGSRGLGGAQKCREQ